MEGSLVIEEPSNSGEIIKSEKINVTAKPNSSTMVYTFHCQPDAENAALLKIQFLDKKGKLVAEKVDIYDMTIIPNEAKGFQYVVTKKGSKYEISFKTDFFTRGIMVSTSPNIMGKYSDNYFDLLPNATKTIQFTPSKGGKQPITFEVKNYNALFSIPTVIE